MQVITKSGWFCVLLALSFTQHSLAFDWDGRQVSSWSDVASCHLRNFLADNQPRSVVVSGDSIYVVGQHAPSDHLISEAIVYSGFLVAWNPAKGWQPPVYYPTPLIGVAGWKGSIWALSQDGKLLRLSGNADRANDVGYFSFALFRSHDLQHWENLGFPALPVY